MPDNIPVEKKGGFEDPAENNAAVAQKLAAQDILGQSMAPKDDGSASSALDALAKSAEETKKKADEAPPVEDKKTPEELAKEAEATKVAEAAAKEAEKERARADELFKDSPGLPPGASHKSAESFAAIKIRAAKEIAAREAELEKLRKEHADAQEKLKNTAPPESVKELEELRQWRAKLDIEADPKFKEFDKTVEQTREFIYSQLSRSPVVTPEIIAEIKKHGGPENVQMDKIFAAIKDPTLQRTVEAKLADIEMVKFSKNKAIESARANVAAYVEERSKSATQALTNHNTATEKHFGELSGNLKWLSDRPVDPKADEATRKGAEEHNAFVATTKQNLAAALKDDSPEMRAIMLAGMAQLFYLQRVHDGTIAENEGLKKSLADVTGKYDKLRQGSVSRLRESGAPPGGSTTPAANPSDQFHKTATQSLDDIAKQVMEERSRVAAAGGK
jgi:hypothetical protein